MAAAGTKASTELKEIANAEAAKAAPRSLSIAGRGVRTNTDFANLMSALMSDLIEGKVTPQVGNGVCNAGGKLLKVVEMSFKYGTEGKQNGRRTLILSVEEQQTREG